MKVVFVSADTYTTDAKQLLQSAVESGHASGATELEDAIVKLRTQRTALEVRMNNHKKELGFQGQSSPSKPNVKLPYFSGDLNEIDYYTFRQEFKEYLVIAVMTVSMYTGRRFSHTSAITLTNYSFHSLWPNWIFISNFS